MRRWRAVLLPLLVVMLFGLLVLSLFVLDAVVADAGILATVA